MGEQVYLASPIAVAYEEAIRTRRAAGRGDEYALVLLVHKGILGDFYYLNKRPEEHDRVYSKRIGIFGGKVEKDDRGDPTRTQEAAAEREIREETGLEIGQSLIHIADITGYNNTNKETFGSIFLKIFRKSQTGRIRQYLKGENPRLRAEGKNEIGDLIVIHHWFGKFFLLLPWRRLTPQAAYALRDILERDPTR